MKTGKSAIAVSYASRRLFTLSQKTPYMVLKKASGKLANHMHFRHECLQKVDTFFRSGQLSDILIQQIWLSWKSTAEGFTIKLICMCNAEKPVLPNEKQNTFVIFYHNRDAKQEKDPESEAKLLHTHVHTHTRPNLPHISLTVLSEDVYRLARDLFPIWQNQEHLNGLWKKNAPQNFYMDICKARAFRVVLPYIHQKSHVIPLFSD